MNLLISWLAKLFEAFKLKNPLVATVVLLVLSAAIHTVNNGTLWGLFSLPSWAAEAISYVSTFLLAVTGSQTFRYLSPEQQEKAR